jgi:hypothetical protein
MPKMSPLSAHPTISTLARFAPMHYLQAYRFVFKSANWLTNLLLTSVCSIIPMIGQIVLIGYFFEVIDVFLRRRTLERLGEGNRSSEAFGERVMDALPADEDYAAQSYPDFNFNRFADYLTRGIWPFLIRLVVNLTVAMVAFFFFVVGMMAAGVAVGAVDSPLVFLALYGAFWIVYLFIMLIVGILTTPLYLRAGLSGDFATAFSLTFYRDFMQRVGKEVILAEVFLAASGAVLSVVGLLMCYIGLFPAMALLLYAHHHLEYQLYELYLERGGTPVERKDKSSPRYAEEDAPALPDIQTEPRERSTDVMRPEQEW